MDVDGLPTMCDPVPVSSDKSSVLNHTPITSGIIQHFDPIPYPCRRSHRRMRDTVHCNGVSNEIDNR